MLTPLHLIPHYFFYSVTVQYSVTPLKLHSLMLLPLCIRGKFFTTYNKTNMKYDWIKTQIWWQQNKVEKTDGLYIYMSSLSLK